jgi:hypothetical protein
LFSIRADRILELNGSSVDIALLEVSPCIFVIADGLGLCFSQHIAAEDKQNAATTESGTIRCDAKNLAAFRSFLPSILFAPFNVASSLQLELWWPSYRKGRSTDAEQFGCLGDIVVGQSQGAADHVDLSFRPCLPKGKNDRRSSLSPKPSAAAVTNCPLAQEDRALGRFQVPALPGQGNLTRLGSRLAYFFSRCEGMSNDQG